MFQVSNKKSCGLQSLYRQTDGGGTDRSMKTEEPIVVTPACAVFFPHDLEWSNYSFKQVVFKEKLTYLNKLSF